MNDKVVVAIWAAIFIAAIAGVAFVIPRYKVYSKTLAGQAELQEAEYTRKIATLDADAEIARAYGVAAADSIISGGLRGEVEYLQYLWIQAIREGNCEAIYIPNDGSLPLMKEVVSP